MVIDEMIFVINVGDSRAIMSIDAGAQIGVLSRDHKPDDELGQRTQWSSAQILISL